eukprot:70449-Rhodomonas_salina.2
MGEPEVRSSVFAPPFSACPPAPIPCPHRPTVPSALPPSTPPSYFSHIQMSLLRVHDAAVVVALLVLQSVAFRPSVSSPRFALS